MILLAAIGVAFVAALCGAVLLAHGAPSWWHRGVHQGRYTREDE